MKAKTAAFAAYLVTVRDTKFASGPIALQWGRGTVKFRKVGIKTL